MGNILFVSYLASGQEGVGVYLLIAKVAVHNAAQRQGIAIENARLTGDMATAQELQSYYDSVLSAGRQAALEFKNMDIQNQRALLELEIQRKFGWDQAAAELYLMQKQAQGQDLSNIYQELQNSYARRMM